MSEYTAINVIALPIFGREVTRMSLNAAEAHVCRVMGIQESDYIRQQGRVALHQAADSGDDLSGVDDTLRSILADLNRLDRALAMGSSDLEMVAKELENSGDGIDALLTRVRALAGVDDADVTRWTATQTELCTRDGRAICIIPRRARQEGNMPPRPAR